MNDEAAYVIRHAIGQAGPVIATIPHAGLLLTDAVRDALAPGMDHLPITDWHLDRLYDFLPARGVTTVQAVANRFVVDANRDPAATPLYPGRFETGLVPLTTFSGDQVFAKPPTPSEVDTRRARWHAPYHDAIADLLDSALKSFSTVLLLDLHSVASGANRLHPALENEIYLGNRDGAACSTEILEAVRDRFERSGLSVSINTPYKGGYTTDQYGRRPNVEALQIEMCQRVYMDEANPNAAWETKRFTAAKARLEAIFSDLLSVVTVLLA